MALANTLVTDSVTTAFTCSNAGGSAVVTVAFINDDAATRTVELHACPAAEAFATDNKILQVDIPSGDAYIFDSKLLLANGDDLKVVADATNVVGCTVSYLDL